MSARAERRLFPVERRRTTALVEYLCFKWIKFGQTKPSVYDGKCTVYAYKITLNRAWGEGLTFNSRRIKMLVIIPSSNKAVE